MPAPLGTPLTPLELRGVFLRAERALDLPIPELERDPTFAEAADRGLLKLQQLIHRAPDTGVA
ncbi:MAG TPA: hypothetical protein VEB59_12645 [Gemmatimonadales bacterium]|nr:hypothetical protein [Gemmatimonadales bacterium]